MQEFLAVATAEANPQVHLWLLQARMSQIRSAKDKKGESLTAEAKAPLVQEMLKSLDKTIRQLPADRENRWYHRLAEVSAHLADLCIQIKRPIMGLSWLRKAVAKVQSHPQEFTSVHAQLARLSFAAKCYQHNMRYFDKEFIDIKCANTTKRQDCQQKLDEEKEAEQNKDKRVDKKRDGKKTG